MSPKSLGINAKDPVLHFEGAFDIAD